MDELFEDQQVNKERVHLALTNWTSFNEHLQGMNGSELLVAFRLECMQMRRDMILRRLVQRLRVHAADRMERFLKDQQQTIYGEQDE